MQLSEHDLIKAYWWPFEPPEREFGWIYDFESLKHTFASRAVVADEPADGGRARFIALAAGALVRQVGAFQEAAAATDEAAAELRAVNQDVVAGFTEGLLASPPACEVQPGQPTQIVVVINGVVVVIPIPVPPPHLEKWPNIKWPDKWPDALQSNAKWPNSELSALDLQGVALRLQAGAEVLPDGPLRADLLAGATRLFDEAATR